MDEKDCKCPPHEWDGVAIRAAVEAAIQANGFLRNRFADLDGPNQPVGFAPCHTRTHAADVVAHFWKDQAVGIGGPRLGQWLVTYHVYVSFSPCKKQLKPGQFVMNDPEIPNVLIDQHSTNDSPIVVAPIEPGTSLNLGFVNPLTPIASTGSLATDPNTLLNVALAVKVLKVSVSVPAGSTIVLPADILRADLATLENVSSKAKANANAASMAWLIRAVTVLNGPDSWTLSLPPGQWAIYQSQGASGTSTSTSTTTPPPPITPPSTTPSIPSSSVKRFGPRS